MQPGPFGPFVLLEPLARGGMGEVWLARRFGLKNIADVVVVKVTRADQAQENESRQRFRDETRIAVLLAHPCIARTIDAGRADGMDFLALEAVDGIPLIELEARMAHRHEPLPEHVALYVAACVLDGLAFAHTAAHPLTHAPLGVVHRDISPHNVMVAADGAVKIIDFGVALSTLKEAQTEQGIVVGKMAYMAPEQARGGGIDARADVFAVGVVLYEMLAGERYYPRMTADAIWRVAGTGQYVAPRLEQMAPDVRRVLARALDPEPARRTQSAATMRAEVSALLVMRGGPVKAARDLAALVHRHAGEEVARMARARVAAQQVVLDREDTTTESIASAEGLAIDAALRAQVADPVTVRLETFASLPVVDEPIPEEPAVRHMDVARTAIVSRARFQPDEPTTTPLRERYQERRSAGAPIALALGGVLVLGAALAAGFFWGQQQVAPAADAGVVASARTTDAGVAVADAGLAARADADADADAGVAVATAADAGAAVAPIRRDRTRQERLIVEARKVRGCDDSCADPWKPVPVERINAATPQALDALEGRLKACIASCRR